jgi:hypothetical protein
MIAYCGGLFVDTLSQASAGMAGWGTKSGMVRGRSRGSGFTKTKNTTNEASMLLKTNEAFRKRTQNEPELSAQGAHLTQNSSFLTPHAFRLGSGMRECAQVRDCPSGGDPEAREKIQEQWKQSQEVVENKGYHFSGCCKLRAPCAPISTNWSRKGAKTAQFAKTKSRVRSRKAMWENDKKSAMADHP